jgi:hypothetical protein
MFFLMMTFKTLAGAVKSMCQISDWQLSTIARGSGGCSMRSHQRRIRKIHFILLSRATKVIADELNVMLEKDTNYICLLSSITS